MLWISLIRTRISRSFSKIYWFSSSLRSNREIWYTSRLLSIINIKILLISGRFMRNRKLWWNIKIIFHWTNNILTSRCRKSFSTLITLSKNITSTNLIILAWNYVIFWKAALTILIIIMIFCLIIWLKLLIASRNRRILTTLEVVKCIFLICLSFETGWNVIATGICSSVVLEWSWVTTWCSEFEIIPIIGLVILILVKIKMFWFWGNSGHRLFFTNGEYWIGDVGDSWDFTELLVSGRVSSVWCILIS